MLSLLIVGSFMLGATTLEEFALALLVGLISGAYSSIFIASPVLAMLKEREPRFKRRPQAHRGRRASVPAARSRRRPVRDDVVADAAGGEATAAHDRDGDGRRQAPPTGGSAARRRPSRRGRGRSPSAADPADPR